MKQTQTQLNLPGMPKAKQGREVAPQWAWTEASVWTERMLATLERGIKGGKWFSLIDKVWKMENLQSAVMKVAQGKSEKKADGRRCRRYARGCGACSANGTRDRDARAESITSDGQMPTSLNLG